MSNYPSIQIVNYVNQATMLSKLYMVAGVVGRGDNHYRVELANMEGFRCFAYAGLSASDQDSLEAMIRRQPAGSVRAE